MRDSPFHRPLTADEAAKRLNVSERFVRKLVSTRQIPYLKVGRLIRFNESDLAAYLESRRVEPEEQVAL